MNDKCLIIKGRREFLNILSNELGNYGVSILDKRDTYMSNNHYMQIDQDIIIAILGSGGLMSVLTAYFKNNKKYFKIKMNNNNISEIECTNMNLEEINTIIREIKDISLKNVKNIEK